MSCSVHDVVALEARGVPTVAIITAPFRAEGQEQAEVLGMPDYAPLELPHPIQPVPLERVVGLADAVADEIARRLVADRA